MTDATIDPESGARAEPFDPALVRHSSLYNEDLAPVPAARRTWGTYNYAALWIAMSVNIPTYLLASAMIAGGMNWKQAIFTVFLGNVLVLIPMLLNAHAGAQYGIPFPVFARSAFGVLGANVPAILRALVACGWFGIQTVDRRRSDLHDDAWRSSPAGKAFRGAFRCASCFSGCST